MHTQVKNEPISITFVCRILKIFDIGSYTLAHHTRKCLHTTLWNAERFHFFFKVIWIPTKIRLLWNTVRNLNFRHPVTVIFVDTSFLSFSILIHPLPCSDSIHSMFQQSWCGWHGCCNACFAVSLHLIHIPGHSVNSYENHSKNLH